MSGQRTRTPALVFDTGTIAREPPASTIAARTNRSSNFGIFMVGITLYCCCREMSPDRCHVTLYPGGPVLPSVM